MSQQIIPEQVANSPRLLADKTVICRAATTANITLSGTQTVDGVALVAGDWVLCKDQSTQSARGVYEVAAGAWSRATEYNVTAHLDERDIYVTEGTTNAKRWFVCSTRNPTVGTTSLTFAQIPLGIGTGADQGCSGNDSRLTNSRAPTAHQSTHVPGGSDALPWGTVHGRGTTAAKPAAAAGNSGYLYYDTDLSQLQRSTGSAWESVEGAGGGGGMTNPMTTAGDIIVGGASGTPGRLGKPAYLKDAALYNFDGVPVWAWDISAPLPNDNQGFTVVQAANYNWLRNKAPFRARSPLFDPHLRTVNTATTACVRSSNAFKNSCIAWADLVTAGIKALKRLSFVCDTAPTVGAPWTAFVGCHTIHNPVDPTSGTFHGFGFRMNSTSIYGVTRAGTTETLHDFGVVPANQILYEGSVLFSPGDGLKFGLNGTWSPWITTNIAGTDLYGAPGVNELGIAARNDSGSTRMLGVLQHDAFLIEQNPL